VGQPASRFFRSVSLTLREAWAQLCDKASFLSKLSDCDGESSETHSALDFAKDCGYVSARHHSELVGHDRKISRMPVGVMK